MVAKRRRSDADTKKKESPLVREDATAAPSKSLLEQSEVAFPRGGASALSALELKEVANEAARDVLFESEGAAIKSDASQRPNKKKKTAKTIKAGTDEDKIQVTIESLSYKRLMTGTLVLGQVTDINRTDIVLALPDNLVGYVPITSISHLVTKALEALEASDDESDDDDDEDKENPNKITSGASKSTAIPELTKMFRIGQWLRAVVLESVSIANKKKNQKKRIQLSIEPERVNKALEDEDLIFNTSLQVSVKAIEDHGAILETGKDIGGFISKKEISAAGYELENLVTGSVFLSTITNKNARTLTVKFNTNKKVPLSTISSVDAIVPGNFIEVLVSEVKSDGLLTRAYGMIDATINLAHCGAYSITDLKHKYAVGSKVKARVTAVLIANDSKKLMLSVTPNALNMELTSSEEALSAFPMGHIFESVEVAGLDSNYIYVSITGDRIGQIHISRIDSKMSNLAVFYAPGSTHKARVLGYSQFDQLYTLTSDPAVINQKYLRAQDVPVGELVTAEIVSASETGLQVKIFDKYEAHVSPVHMSDVKLIYPERKFKIGSKVKGRVLSVSKFKSEISITLKKSLVGIENVITTFEDLKVGDRTSVSVFAFKPSGAIVSFFGSVKAFLPKSEISETFVRKPEDHLRLGQTITVRISSVDSTTKRATVSCRLSEESTEAQKNALSELVVGRSIVTVHIVEKTKESVVVELPGNNLRGVIFAGHLSDGNYEQNRAILKRLSIGSSIDGLVLDKDARSRIFNLSVKKSLIDAAKTETFPVKFKDISVRDSLIPGYVKSVTNKGVFVAFGAKLVGLILAKYATERPVDDLSSVFHVNQSISVKVLRVDEENKRFLLTLKDKRDGSSATSAINPVDKSITSSDDLVPGRVTEARIKSVKQTQLNVQLADNIQGRIDISQIFDSFNEIKDPLYPLHQFSRGDVLKVKVIGYHDARNHRFLPVSHKKSKDVILELTAKASDIKKDVFEPLTLEKVSIGSEQLVFINNAITGFFFVSLSPTVRGRVSLMDLTSDSSTLGDLEENFPIGSALLTRVKEVDTEHNSVRLTARSDSVTSLEDAKVGSTLPARVFRVSENFVVVELSENVTAISFITDALDDYTKKLEDVFSKNDICSATILEVDTSNKKIYVSLRTDSTTDKLIKSSSDLKRGDLVRGFVKNVTDKGVFVSVGRTVTAYIKVSNLSDSFIKEWKKFYKVHMPVLGKVVSADDDGNVILTLKESEVNGDLNILKRFEDLKVDDVFEGSVKRVTDFGVFVKLDGTLNISGLCHHSQISDNAVSNIGALFGEGDRVKVKVLDVNQEKKQLSLGMKVSYFQDDAEIDNSSDEDDIENSQQEDDSAQEDNDEDDDDEMDEAVFEGNDNDSDSDDEEMDDADHKETGLPSSGLGTSGFDWTASILDQAQDDDSSDDDDFAEVRTKKRKRSKDVVEDTTGDINSKVPQSTADFERLIIGNANSSIVWMNYMAFQLQLSEVEKAREIAERALKSINYREEQEKLNIWIALLNLENTFGTDETLEETFKRSNEYMEPLTMHQKMASIYIMSEKFGKADSLFKVMAKKFGKSSVAVWVSYGSYLLDLNQSEKAREVLASALNVLPKRDHIETVRKFAQLEFTKGDPEQGRTLFEGLLADVAKRIDLWNVYIDQEIKKGDKQKVEDLFERMFTRKLTRKQAKFFFGKWLSFEEQKGDSKAADYVKAKAQEYVQSHS